MSQSIFPRACLRFMRYTPSLLLALVPLVCHAQSGQFRPRRQIAVSLGASGPTASFCTRLLSDGVTEEDLKARFSNMEIAGRVLNLSDCIQQLPKESIGEQIYFLSKTSDYHDAVTILLTRALQFMDARSVKEEFMHAPLPQKGLHDPRKH